MNAAVPQQPRPPFNPHLAFMQNLQPEWRDRFERLGLDVLLVTFDMQRGSPIFDHPELEQSLGAELEQIGAGVFDSSFWANSTAFHIFHANDLAKAISLLKKQIEIRGLFPITKILHRETATAWRCYCSPTASEVAQLVEDEFNE